MAHNIYIPSQFSNANWSATDDIDPYVHDSIMSWLQTKIFILDWLKSLGVAEKTDEMFIHRKIIPHMRNYITPENALPTVKKLFTGFRNGRIRNDLLQQLNKLKLLSVEGTLVPADELYFSDPYLPRLPLTNFHLDGTNFLSPSYLNEMKSDTNTMKQFFLQLGVQEDIKLIRFNEDQHNELVAAYRFKQTETLFQFRSLQFQRRLILPFLEITQRNYDFALYFWQHVIQSKDELNQLIETEILLCDQQIRRVDNLPCWFVRTRVCIPTTTRQLLKSTDVFSGDLRSIAGDLLPVFACTTVLPFSMDWQRFFQFKTQFSIQDHIQMLNLIYDRSKSSPLNDENEACIQRVYSGLMNCLSRFDKKQLDQYRPKAPFYLLSTVNNEFLPSTNLVISISKDFVLPNQIPQLKLSTGNSRDPPLACFLDFFNIRQIGINDLALLPNINAQPSLLLRAKIRDMQAHLYELTHARNITDHRIDHDLEVFEVDRLELYYNGTVPVLQLPIHVTGNRIYVTRPWNSPGVMSKFPQMLSKQFKLPSDVEADIRHFLLNEQVTPSMVPLVMNPSVDLLQLRGTRAKFAMVIDRGNEQLFSYLGITNTTSPADLLTVTLDRQKSSFAGYVYHCTHLENAVSILRDRAIKCRNNLLVNSFKDSAAKNVIETTRTEVKDYARFYFRPLTPTQYCNENLGLPNLSSRYGNQPMCPVPIIFRINLDAILAIENIQWKVRLGNSASSQTEFDNTMNVVKRFDFQGVYADIHTERGQYSSQQEFLIKSQLNFEQLNNEHITIIFQDENARHSLECMIAHHYFSKIDTSFYFGLNSRMIIKSTNTHNNNIVSIENIDPMRVYGQLILQLSGNDMNRTVQGNLNKCFQRDTVSTAYANQQLSFIGDLNNIQYAVYYEYENQRWLIHTNSPQPRFISPT